MKKRKSSGLFRKYFLVTISIILASFVFLGGALLLFVSKLWMDEKTALLEENTLSVAQNTAAVLGSDYLGESGRGSVIVICNTLHQISNAIDADVFITNTEGQVVYCKEILFYEKLSDLLGFKLQKFILIIKQINFSVLDGDEAR